MADPTRKLGNKRTFVEGAVATENSSGVVIDPALESKQLPDGHNVTVDNVAGTNPVPVQGDAAENAPVTGNPVLHGGRYDTTNRTLDNGDVGAVALDSKGVTRTNDLGVEIPAGNVPGTSSVNKFGRNPDIDTATDPEDVWDAGGLWVPPTASRTHDIVSTSANDSGLVQSSGTATGGSTTSLIDTGADFVADGVAVGDTVIVDTPHTDAQGRSILEHSTVTVVATTTLTTHVTRHGTAFTAGDAYRVVNADSTGASIAHVFGLGSDMTSQSEFIVMNGVTNVPTVNPYWRIFRMHVDGAAGRTVTNVGTITATAQTDGTVTAQINIGNGQTLMAVYTIPAGKTGYLTNLYASMNRGGGASAFADVSLRETPFASIDGAGSRIQHFTGLSNNGSSHIQHMFKPYKPILEQTDVWIRVDTVSANDTDVSAGFDIILVNNT